MVSIREFAPDLIVVAAYGQILRPNLLELPRYGCVNVHGSLLPRWRGAAPIQAAILAGDAETGITIMLMDAGIDTGDMLSQRALPIADDDTAETLFEKLAPLGADLLIETLPCFIEGKIAPKPQPQEGVTLCRLVKKEHARIDWTRPATEIERMVRAYQPWPGAFTTWAGQTLKIGGAKIAEGQAQPGQVIPWEKGVAIGTGAGLLLPTALQLPGKKMLPVDVFLRGKPDFTGARLGA